VEPEILLVEGGVGARIAKTVLVLFASLAFVAGGIALFWVDWRWGLGVTLVFSLGVLFSVPPIARVGRYRLTNHRLTWRPVFGSPREIPVGEITGIDVDADTASIKLAPHRLMMGSVAKVYELWGALVLAADMARLPSAPGGTPIAPTTVVWRAVRGASAVTGAWGTAVLRPDYVAFVPDAFADRRSKGRQAAALAAGVGLALIGVGLVSVQAKPPVQTVIAHARATASSERFDAIVARLVDLTGGVIVARGDAAIAARPLSPHAGEVKLSLRDGTVYTGQVEAALAGYLAHLTAGGTGHRSAGT